MSIRIEHGDLDRLVADLDKVASRVPDEAEKVVAKGALNIKNGARQRVGSPAHAPAYPAALGYDMTSDRSGPSAEIGADKNKRQGALANLIEYGSVNNPPKPHIRPAADEELPKFERAMEDLAAKLLEGR